jgi:hypothetical protein
MSMTLSLIMIFFISDEFAPCRIELENLLNTKRGEHIVSSRQQRRHNQLGVGTGGRVVQNPPISWKPQGVLMSHLHEHSMGIVKLAAVPNEPLFASAALDGCVRVSRQTIATHLTFFHIATILQLWDVGNMEKTTNLVNRAFKRYSHHDGDQLTSLAVVGDIFASGAENGTICVSR